MTIIEKTTYEIDKKTAIALRKVLENIKYCDFTAKYGLTFKEVDLIEEYFEYVPVENTMESPPKKD